MFGGFKRHRAVVNAMNAKLTWEELDERFRLGVQSAAENLYMSGGRSAAVIEDDQRRSKAEDRISGMNELHRWSLYAMALEQIGIPPSLGGESWDNSRNPFTLQAKQNDILDGSEYFSRNHGVSVTLDLINELVRTESSQAARTRSEQSYDEVFESDSHTSKGPLSPTDSSQAARTRSEQLAVPTSVISCPICKGRVSRQTSNLQHCRSCGSSFDDGLA